jgi:hypothetical protein
LYYYWKRYKVAIYVYDYGQNIPLPTDPSDFITRTFSSLFQQSNIAKISFAIATELNALQTLPSSSDTTPAISLPIALLADTSSVRRQYSQSASRTGLRIFPMAFSPRVCCFQSKAIPTIYQKYARPVQRYVASDNGFGTESGDSPLSTQSFQGYSGLKQMVRPTKSQFGLGQSTYTAAYALPLSQLPFSKRKKHAAMYQDASDHQPFEQLFTGVSCAIANNHLTYRFEPVNTVDVEKLDLRNRNSTYFASEIIIPMLEIWTNHTTEIAEELLVGFEYQVFIK